MHRYNNLKVWNESRELVKLVYQSLNQFPKEELFGLTSQIKRSVISISSNIAEACGRDTDQQFAYHINIALGSSFEFESQITLAYDVSFLAEQDFENISMRIFHIKNMLIGLHRNIKSNYSK
jgi:four helix bundle protein